MWVTYDFFHINSLKKHKDKNIFLWPCGQYPTLVLSYLGFSVELFNDTKCYTCNNFFFLNLIKCKIGYALWNINHESEDFCIKNHIAVSWSHNNSLLLVHTFPTSKQNVCFMLNSFNVVVMFSS